MPFTVILLVTRKPGLELSAFRNHWEHTHIPLLKSLVGDDFPLSHTRHYLDRDTALPASPANVLKGAQEDFAFDALALWTFADQAHWERFKGKWKREDVRARLEGDEEGWMDRGRLRAVVVGWTGSTGRDGGDVGWRFVGSV
ncbi:hypothetical protein K491DRAFT_481729 [Lophiostoma macrostomum CBS 122681]|uniref:EthD domain-containing protein n=1 Tax=Lophiostoma macrostomum CBS 122681 TaxID=1314788 RepID=A0A6A6TPV6_9PLEO|nr:hypothetical protein K491DRAFT_481729 [Lophiostoma macrostomum CBS 122681]